MLQSSFEQMPMTSEINVKTPIDTPLNPSAPILFILLGASNLSRGYFALSKHLKANLHPRKVEVLIASGPGRAYCASGGLLNVTYPPIQSSEIFEVARNKSECGYQVVSLVTDIGNDIMYGVSTEQVIETIRQVFVKLQSLNAKFFFTMLPITFEKEDHPILFRILSSLLFTRSTVTYDEATAGVKGVNQFLRDSAGKCGHLINDMDRYVGFDKIHYGRLQAHNAWSHVARVMLEELGVEGAKEISLPMMLQSYWQEFRQVVGADIMKFKKNNPEHL